MPDLSGRRLGNYQLASRVGQGGMAIVYQGTHLLTGETVAVKVLSSQAADEANFARRFRREARVLMELKHPHIVPVTDFGEVDELAYLVMPYLRVGNLAQRLQQGPLNAVEGGRVFGEIASALAYAHEKGIVHRDVKPSNVLLTEDGKALLSDFGLAQIHDASVSLTGSMMLGTPAYVSPEMVRGEPVDARADQYALGIILFEMTTGHLPFNAETPMAILVKQANEPLPRPRDISPNIPETVERVILRATAKNPRDRFGSVLEMNHYFQAALAHALDPQRFRAPTIALPETALAKAPPRQEKRRRRRWAALVPALLLLILCPTAFAMRDILLPPAQGASAYEDLSAPQLTALSGTIAALSTQVVADSGETLSPEDVATRVAGTVAASPATPEPDNPDAPTPTGSGATSPAGGPATTAPSTPGSGQPATPTRTRTPTSSVTPGGPTLTATMTPTPGPSPTPTRTDTPSPVPSGAPTTPPVLPTFTRTPTLPPTATRTPTAGVSPTKTPTPSKTPFTPMPSTPMNTPMNTPTDFFPPTVSAPVDTPTDVATLTTGD